MARISPSVANILLTVALILACLGVALPCWASPPALAFGDLDLPWACGEAYRVTWGPQDHWEHGKARGVAFDFAMPEGTALYAPCDGTAHFWEDRRPLETNYGHYVEIVSESGELLVRLAHLRDPQQGQGSVHQGELIGYSGRSGVWADHLHLELLIRADEAWICPRLEDIDRLFGMPLESFVKGAFIARDDCVPELRLAADIRPSQPAVTLGEPFALALPLRNEGGRDVTLRLIQVALVSPSGESMMIDIHGEWVIPGGAQYWLDLQLWPERAGDWALQGVRCVGPEISAYLPAQFHFAVRPPPFEVTQIDLPSGPLIVGEAIGLGLVVENKGDADLSLGQITVLGEQPDGTAWQVSSAGTVFLPEGRREVAFETLPVARAVGQWRVTSMAFESHDRRFYLDLPAASVEVQGPQLVARHAQAYATPRQLSVFLHIVNCGTTTLAPTAIEVWGWKSDQQTTFAGSQRLAAPLPPGALALVQIDIPWGDDREGWQLVEAGYWHNGSYLDIPLPTSARAMVHPDALDGGVW